MIIVNVNFEVLVEVIDSLREKGYLHFGGTGVALFSFKKTRNSLYDCQCFDQGKY